MLTFLSLSSLSINQVTSIMPHFVPYYPIIYSIVYYICICINSRFMCYVYALCWPKSSFSFSIRSYRRNSNEFSSQSNITYINMLYCINNKVIGNSFFSIFFQQSCFSLVETKISFTLVRLLF